MDLELRHKTALVTGGARGLGRAICLRLAAEGARVGVNYRRGVLAAEAVVREIEGRFGTQALAVPGDVSREEDVLAMFCRTEERMGLVEILVNNAAICPTCPMHELSLAEWNETLAVNLTGTFLACRQMVQRLLTQGQTGRIVNISSQAAFRGSTTGHAPYDASKGGVVALTVSLARELASQGIAVNAVAPGMIRTDMTADVLDAHPNKYLARIPLGRIGLPEEVADVVVFLSSARAGYMTGATVDVSGGMLMR